MKRSDEPAVPAAFDPALQLGHWRDDAAWQSWSEAWELPPGVTFLNHGSFGLAPRVVRQQQRHWMDQLAREPVDFFVRRMEPLLCQARESVAQLVGTSADHLVLLENATSAMNVLAGHLALQPGDEVLSTDHDYGAVLRIWQRVCQRAGATLVTCPVGRHLTSPEALAEQIAGCITPRTRLVVVSHITSPTALKFPIQQIAELAHRRQVPVCVDGPHALAVLDVALDSSQIDFYTASCHKWLCAPLGTGFLYVHPRQQSKPLPAVLSWGRHPPDKQNLRWTDEFTWPGTRDPSGLLTLPTAIQWMTTTVGLDNFRRRTHALAQYARERLLALTGLPPLVPDDEDWYGSMVTLPLPLGSADQLHNALWEQYRIEVPIIDWNGGRWIRVSCHLYTSTAQLDYLVQSLGHLLATENPAQ